MSGVHYIHYVGETSSLAKRQREHLYNILGLNYGIWDVSKVEEMEAVLLWRGLWRIKDNSEVGEIIEFYGNHTKNVLQYIDKISIFAASIESSASLRKHLEGCIGMNLRKKNSVYSQFYPSDNRIGVAKDKHGKLMFISCDEKIMGLDTEMPY